MDRFDLLVVGGGINGAAIARDAAGRGLKVLLVEKDDLAAHTSSASSKLIHGGLRYLEQREFRLVRESLGEREILLRAAPHVVRPLRFVLPDRRGGRPTWLLRLGLKLYDLLAGRSTLPPSHRIPPNDPARQPLKPGFSLLGYWDASVDDARLVVLNAIDAAERGAEIATRTELLAATRAGEWWQAHLPGGRRVSARMIVNAAGPWVERVLRAGLGASGRSGVRLIKGSHIVVPRLWEGEHAYILQQPDGRVVFALPYEGFSLIGTTDVPVTAPEEAQVSSEEIDYLCAAANAFFLKHTSPTDPVWSYAGIRALYDDGSAAAKDVTRDYRLELDPAPGPKLVSVFGGKITTARALAEEVLATLGVRGRRWTANAYLPGGEMNDLSDDSYEQFLSRVEPWLPPPLTKRFDAAYGARIAQILAGAGSVHDLGLHFGAGLYEREIAYLREKEFARTADDILWRRTKLGLRMTADEQQALRDFLGA